LARAVPEFSKNFQTTTEKFPGFSLSGDSRTEGGTMNIKLIGTQEAAEIAGVSEQTIRNRIRDKTLPAQLVSGRWVILSDPDLGLLKNLKTIRQDQSNQRDAARRDFLLDISKKAP